MRVTINKSSPKGIVSAPPSKSMAHRMLICSLLSEGRSVIHGIAPSQDVLATIDCLKSLGANLTYEGDTVTIDGIGLKRRKIGKLSCRESGSTLRFFLPVCMLFDEEILLCGSETLLKRPLSVYEEICKKQGIRFVNDGKQISVFGKISGGEYIIPGNISSQFVTGLLFALPLVKEDSKIRITKPIESLPYINLTIQVFKKFGVTVEWLDECTLFIKGNQKFSPLEAWVEGDYSNAAFFDAFNYLGSNVSLTGLNEESHQGDKVYKELFKQLFEGRAEIDISNCPDLGPILFALAAAKWGGRFTGTKRLEIKESNRGYAMSCELQKFGVSVEVGENSIVVNPTDFHKPNATLYGHNDHRIVMALCVLLTLVGGTIDGAEAVNKSMPDFFEKLTLLGTKITYENE